MKKIFFIWCFCSVVFATQANTYYISSTGNDSNSGLSPAEAWLTIAQVNAFSFSAGDEVLFEANTTFDGNIDKPLGAGGVPGSPVTFGSYGTGKATIFSNMSEAIYIALGNVVIKDLIFKGAGYMQTSYWINGMDFLIEKNAAENFDNILIDNVEVYGFGGWGIFFATESPDYSYNHVQITNCKTHSNGFGGIAMIGYWDAVALLTKRTNTDFYLARNVAYDNLGRYDYKDNWSGTGIMVSGVTGGLIENCEAYNNGIENGSTYAGPVGILLGECKGVTVQHCKSHNNFGGLGKRDGGGFDLDGGCENSVIQFCESYENDGAGYGLYHWATGNAWINDTIRHNTSYNDGRNTNLYGAFTFWGVSKDYKVSSAVIHDNYVKLDLVGSGIKILNNNLANIKVYDNVFCLTSPAVYMSGTSVNITITNSSFPCTVLSIRNNSFNVKRVQ